MDDKSVRQQEKREARRKRRIRNQVIAYTALVILVVAAAVGVVFGADFLTAMRQEEEQRQQEESQDKIDDILASEEVIPTPEPDMDLTSEADPEPTWEERLDTFVDGKIAEMSLEDRVAGLFIVTPESITGVNAATQASDGTRQALEKHPVGGLFYSKRNIYTENQFGEMLRNSAQYAKYPLFLAVGEEGGNAGSVAAAEIGGKTAGAAEIGATGDADKAYQAGADIGKILAGLGINLNFAPVADLANVANSVMAGRSYGSDPAAVAGFAMSMMKGLEEQGVTACMKHFPGIGSTTVGTDAGRAFTDRSEEQFLAEELTVFQAGIDAGAKMVMVGNIIAPGLTGDNNPCIFSEKLVTGILREQMGYEGVIVTDSLSDAAITAYCLADEAAIRALLAGCDVLLAPDNYELAYEGVLAAVRNGNVSEERVNDSLRRVYRIKYASMVE